MNVILGWACAIAAFLLAVIAALAWVTDAFSPKGNVSPGKG